MSGGDRVRVFVDGVKKGRHEVCKGKKYAGEARGKDGTKSMPKQPKRTQPKVDLREDELKEITVRIRTSVHDAISQYIAFHQESMGFKPNESKVIDHGMEAFFKSDDGFQTYLKKRPKTGKGVVSEGGKVGGPSNAGRLHPGRGTSL